MSAARACSAFRNYIADVLGVGRDKVRILTDRVGGSFGMKQATYAEYYCILHAARELGRPVKWTDERSGSFVSDSHGRDHEMTAELALDADGNFLAVRLTGYGNLGAAYGAPGPATNNAVRNTLGVYKTPLIEVTAKCVFSNTTPVGAYRGAGRPEANYYMERLVDAAAAEMGIDKVRIAPAQPHPARRRCRTRAPMAIPTTAATSPRCSTRRWRWPTGTDFAARKEESRKRGRLRGRGIGDYLELTGAAGREMGGIRFEENGDVTIITGTLDYGQGHASPFAQVLAMKLGIPFGRIRLLQGDSDQLIAGGGTGGSKSMITSGTAIVEASDKVIESGKQIAAHVLEAAAADIEFRGGRFVIAGTDRSIGIMELAARLHARPGIAGRAAAEPRRGAYRQRPALGLSPMAVTSPRSRSIRIPAWSTWCATASSMISGWSSTRCWSTARRMAASSRGSARRCASAPSTTSTGSC